MPVVSCNLDCKRSRYSDRTVKYFIKAVSKTVVPCQLTQWADACVLGSSSADFWFWTSVIFTWLAPSLKKSRIRPCKALCNTHTSDQRDLLWFICDVPHTTPLQVCYNVHWNVLQLPIGMHIIMLQLPMACCKNTRTL